MARTGTTIPRMAPLLLILAVTTGCSGSSLGDFDDSNDAREEMPGPGVLADENGQSPLTWSSASKQSEAAASTSNQASATAATSAALSPEQVEFEQFKAWKEFKGDAPAENTDAPALSPEQVEFEQYRTWKKLKTEGDESAEYREFREWVEFQEFKANQ